MNESLIKVPTTIRRSRNRHDQRWILELRCPFCGHIHVHGGGPSDHPPLLGARVPHCEADADYELISIEEGVNLDGVAVEDRRTA
jgi:hypothetical protein